MSRADDRDEPKTPWRPPTRRTFVAMIAAAAAALAVRPRERERVLGEPEPRSQKPIWIGHF